MRNGKQWNCGWDTFSTTGLIQEAEVPSYAVWLSREKSELVGVGGLTTQTAGVIQMDLDLICNGVSRTVILKVANTPRMVDILFGLPQITEFDAVIRCRTQRIYLLDAVETLFTDFLHKIYARSRARALRILSSCDGAATLSIMLRTAGWKIEEYRAVECDPVVKSVARSNFSAIVHVQPGDITQTAAHDAALAGGFIPDVYASSARCEPFSGARMAPGGFNEERSATFVASAALADRCRLLNPELAEMHETVKAHRSLTAHAAKQCRLMKGQFSCVNTAKFQGPVSRPRMIMTNMVDFDAMEHQQCDHLAPSILLNGGFQPKAVPMPCPVSSNTSTHCPMVLSSRVRGKNVERFAVQDERDRLLGYATGFSDNGTGLSDAVRARINGGCVAAELLWLMVTAYRGPGKSLVRRAVDQLQCHVTMDIMSASPEQLELYLINLSDADLDALMVGQITKYGKMPDLMITVKPNTLPFQTKRKIMIQQKLQAPFEAKVAKMIESGGRREVEYSPDLWIHDLIAIQKLPERIDSSTGLLAVRPIGILCAINAARDYDAHLAEEMPSIQEAKHG